jgi:hypothetical protein
MSFKQLTSACLLAGLSTAPMAASISVQNKCDKPVAYKIERKGSTLNTSLPQRTSATQTVDAGDRIKVGDNTVHTVSASSDGQTVVICAK